MLIEIMVITRDGLEVLTKVKDTTVLKEFYIPGGHRVGQYALLNGRLSKTPETEMLKAGDIVELCSLLAFAD